MNKVLICIGGMALTAALVGVDVAYGKGDLVDVLAQVLCGLSFACFFVAMTTKG